VPVCVWTILDGVRRSSPRAGPHRVLGRVRRDDMFPRHGQRHRSDRELPLSRRRVSQWEHGACRTAPPTTQPTLVGHHSGHSRRSRKYSDHSEVPFRRSAPGVSPHPTCRFEAWRVWCSDHRSRRRAVTTEFRTQRPRQSDGFAWAGCGHSRVTVNLAYATTAPRGQAAVGGVRAVTARGANATGPLSARAVVTTSPRTVPQRLTLRP